MQQTTKKNYYEEDVVDLKKIINQLIASRKLIIVITLIFVIVATFFEFRPRVATFDSTILVEIGQSKLDNNKNKFSLIQSTKDLVEELNVVFVYKNLEPVKLSFNTIEERLIEIEIETSSIEIATNKLNQITSYILNKHENIIDNNTQININKINSNLKLLNSEIDFNNKFLRAENEKKIIDIQAKIINLRNSINNIDSEIEFILFSNNERLKAEIIDIKRKLPIIDKKINLLQAILTEDLVNLELLQSDPQLLKDRATQNPTLNQIIHSYKSSILEYQTEKSNLNSKLILSQDSISEIDILLNNKSYHDLSINNSFSNKIFKLQHQKNTFEEELINNSFSNKIFKLQQQKNTFEEESILLQNSISEIKEKLNKNIFDSFSNKIFNLQQQKLVEEKNLQLLINQPQIYSSLIGKIKTVENIRNRGKFVILGFLFGLIVSIFFVIVTDTWKTHKELNA
jgi:hypothetical protein